MFVRKTSLTYDVAMDTAWRSSIGVYTALFHHRGDFVYWPRGAEAQNCQDEYAALAGFPGVVASIDGSEIAISDPTEQPEVYENRKGFKSVKLQGAVLPNMKFCDATVGEVGSMHDARAWRRSPLYELLSDPLEQVTMLPNNGHILGDSAYPLATYLLTPYRRDHPLTPAQERYNAAHSTTRVVVERAFGLLKNRFRCLRYLFRRRSDLLPIIIFACIILHNVCIDLNDEYEVDVEVGPEDENDPPDDLIPQVAEQKRDYIANLL
jgi:hypothetical protein